MKKILALVVLLSLPMLVLAWGRDSGGNFTFTNGAGDVVISNTPISRDWANQSFLDVKSALSDSLSRSGSGAMMYSLTLFDGLNTALDLRWDGANTTGLYHNSGEVGLKVAGSTTQTWTAGGTSVAQGNLTVAAGSLNVAAGSLNVAAGNVIVAGGNVVVSTGDVEVSTGGFNLSSANSQTLTKTGGTNSILGIYNSVAGGNVLITSGAGNALIATGNIVLQGGANSGGNTITYPGGSIVLSPGAGGYISASNTLIKTVLDPVSVQDAANKQYVDAATAGAKSWTTVGAILYTKYRGVVYVRGSVTFSGGNCTNCPSGGTAFAVGSRPVAATPILLATTNSGSLSLSTVGVVTEVGAVSPDATYDLVPFSFIAEN